MEPKGAPVAYVKLVLNVLWRDLQVARVARSASPVPNPRSVRYLRGQNPSGDLATNSLRHVCRIVLGHRRVLAGRQT
jgi:hypothetical protein